ncbi:MAG: hypothetical protein HOP30_07655 [Cyclobacteriaceae bacterium]|nr:hypothetical protein [Cyclobacteriaceae bacterium]
MSETRVNHSIQLLKRRYQLYRLAESALFAVATGMLAATILHISSDNQTLKISLISASVLISFITRVLLLKLFSLKDEQFTSYLNTQYPQLEHSADLLLQNPDSLQGLAQLQTQKITEHFHQLFPKIKLPNLLPQSAGSVVIALLLYVALTSFVSVNPATSAKTNLAAQIAASPTESARIQSLFIQVTPPTYTNLSSTNATQPELKVPEGSKVSWKLKFSSEISSAQLIISGKDSIQFSQSNDGYQVSYQIRESGFYQIQWKQKDKVTRSDFYKIEIIADQPPKITIDNLNQFTKLALRDKLSLTIQSTLSDDYGLSRSIIVATVSKGSGESVKFREEKLAFDQPISGKQLKATRQIDLLKMGMEPGDELYFYVEATDNKTPSPNYNRTETFFITLQDTTKQTIVEDEGLGVDLMPDYFRSQRQIIIDTEKLLKEKKKISLQQFKSTSNELGYDQKVLRLRYGQFLGEEFEDQIGKVEAPSEEDDHESVVAKFGHTHDKENEHNLVAEKKEESHGHDHKGGDGKTELENPLEAFAHNHDDGEQATFFVQSVRAKLKAALTVMWDAELYLRLYQPEKSLPYQYTALRLLKEISNDSRIYVHRTGFDPPPLKEEKRLTADLSEVHNSTQNNSTVISIAFPQIRKALVAIESWQQKNKQTLSDADKKQLQLAGQELARLVVEQPGQYLEGLSMLKRLEESTMNPTEMKSQLASLQNLFWKVLPRSTDAASQSAQSLHSLDQEFLKKVKELHE